jgi:hypothetical protein
MTTLLMIGAVVNQPQSLPAGAAPRLVLSAEKAVIQSFRTTFAEAIWLAGVLLSWVWLTQNRSERS